MKSILLMLVLIVPAGAQLPMRQPVSERRAKLSRQWNEIVSSIRREDALLQELQTTFQSDPLGETLCARRLKLEDSIISEHSRRTAMWRKLKEGER